LTPYLIVKNAAKAIQFYKNAFDATERYRLTEPSAKIGQAHTRPSRLISVHGHSITVS
jgi:PhnB protein